LSAGFSHRSLMNNVSTKRGSIEAIVVASTIASVFLRTSPPTTMTSRRVRA